ncbi:COG3014 family protein [Breznakiella homolactica]|uniref:Uncharacterized protein n=1 Tax=Breznakiella homolactica TaxID=2798577 RepID=A0A7T8BAF1_9SPIR|nr:hypothetical protein [Breznakiella homolactica]QQO09306.1 hypothetical protein JFL75_20645 [Breznakiella homolactica]
MHRFPILLSVTVILLFSCASTGHYDKVDSAVARGDYADAYAKLEDSKSSYRNNDQVLYYLDAGMLAHYAGDYETSSQRLQSGEQAIERAFTKSITMEIGTYLVNDMTQEYAGEDYEDIYLNAFNALNYYHRGSLEGALVEVRRMNNKLQYISTKYGTMITNLQREALESSSEIPYDPAAVTVHFSNSALGRYLGMLFYRGEGHWDDARIDRDQVKLAFANQPDLYPFPLPASLDGELDVPRDKARLNVIGFSGLSPVKVEETLRLPIGNSSYVKIALPVMVSRTSAVQRAEVVLDTGEYFPLELIEDIDAVARETFKQKAGMIYLKSSIRAMTKAGASAVFDQQSKKSNGNESALFMLLSLGTQIYAEASEQADLRISRYFPGKALVGGITLDPGVYSYTVNFYDFRNHLIFQERFENQELYASRLNLTEVVCLN